MSSPLVGQKVGVVLGERGNVEGSRGCDTVGSDPDRDGGVCGVSWPDAEVGTQKGWSSVGKVLSATPNGGDMERIKLV